MGSLDSRKTWKWGGEKGRIICEDGRGLVHVELHATTSTSNDNAGISVLRFKPWYVNFPCNLCVPTVSTL